MTMPTGALVTEIAAAHPGTFGHQCDAIRLADFLPTDCLVPAIPHTENNSALGLAIHLHAEIAAVPATRHVIVATGSSTPVISQ
jgi:hypothetical protein